MHDNECIKEKQIETPHETLPAAANRKYIWNCVTFMLHANESLLPLIGRPCPFHLHAAVGWVDFCVADSIGRVPGESRLSLQLCKIRRVARPGVSARQRAVCDLSGRRFVRRRT